MKNLNESTDDVLFKVKDDAIIILLITPFIERTKEDLDKGELVNISKGTDDYITLNFRNEDNIIAKYSFKKKIEDIPNLNEIYETKDKYNSYLIKVLEAVEELELDQPHNLPIPLKTAEWFSAVAGVKA